MANQTQPDYSKIFASGASVGEILNMPDISYLRGWGYLAANEPPPMEFFNFIMNGYDRKLYYLFLAGYIRKNRTRYEVGEIITTPNLKSNLVLVCKTAGTTDATEPQWPTTATATLNDGSCVWEVRSRTNADQLGGKNRAYYETLFDNTAKIKKITFTSGSATWTADGNFKKFTVKRDGYSCLAAYRTSGANEEQVMSGISMDATNIMIHSPAAFDGYLIAITFTK